VIDFGGIKDMSKAYYEEALAEHGDDPRGVNWQDRETQEMRFQKLTEIGDLAGKKIHDVGCGLAHFCDYLDRQGFDGTYVGSDISANMISAARNRLGDRAELYEGDIHGAAEPWMEADYVVNSGIFTVRGSVPEGEWWQFVQAMIGRMFECARIGIAFNLMTSFVDYRDDHLFYLHPGEVTDFCVSRFGRKFVIRHDYPLWEYMVYLYK
jgi:SAM-dependent methyltransferase